MFKIKVIVIGNTQVGKSSIIKQYITGSYNIEKMKNKTINIQNKEILFFDTQINLEILDIPYSYNKKEFTQIISQNINIVLLVYDITNKKSFNDLSQYYNSISKNNNIKNIIFGIVGNKNDLLDNRNISKEEGEKYAETIGGYFYESSSTNHNNIKIIFEGLSKLFYYKTKLKDDKNILFSGEEIISDDDGTYKGQLINDIKNGKGLMIYNNGCIYVGSWVNGKKEGNGKYINIYKNEIYYGEWVNNIKEGIGKIYYNNDLIFEGSFINGKKEGLGMIIIKNKGYLHLKYKKDIIEEKGVFQTYNNRNINIIIDNNLKIIKGNFILQNGDIYEGEIDENGNREGKGIMNYHNGDSYSGEWKNDMKNGNGRMSYFNVDFYNGYWKNDKKEGKGIMKYNNGDEYNGDWKNDLREGKGKMIYNDIFEKDILLINQKINYLKNQEKDERDEIKNEKEEIILNEEIYDGDWKNNLREGKGIMKYNNGDIYNGEWINDKIEGKGIMKYNNGDIYEGEWIKDIREGKGKMKYNNGDFYNGDWINNKKEGKGIMKYNNGNIYNGEWYEDKREGYGEIKYKNGKYYKGYWTNDNIDNNLNDDNYEIDLKKLMTTK